MPEENPLMFERFQLWLYTGKIVEAPGHLDFPIHSRILANLYIFGEARGMPELQNAVTDEVIDQYEQSALIPTGEIRHIYENTSEKSPIRRLCVDMMIQLSDELSDPSSSAGADLLRSNHWPKEFLADLIIALCGIVAAHGPGKDFSEDRQQYHVSTSDNQGDVEEEKNS